MCLFATERLTFPFSFNTLETIYILHLHVIQQESILHNYIHCGTDFPCVYTAFYLIISVGASESVKLKEQHAICINFSLISLRFYKTMHYSIHDTLSFPSQRVPNYRECLTVFVSSWVFYLFVWDFFLDFSVSFLELDQPELLLVYDMGS